MLYNAAAHSSCIGSRSRRELRILQFLLTRQGRSQIGSMPAFGPLPLVAHETCRHGARMSQTKTLILAGPVTLRLSRIFALLRILHDEDQPN